MLNGSVWNTGILYSAYVDTYSRIKFLIEPLKKCKQIKWDEWRGISGRRLSKLEEIGDKKYWTGIHSKLLK